MSINPVADSDEDAQSTVALVGRVKDAIRHIGIRRASSGAVLISPSGGSQNWLIDLRSVFMRRDAIEAIAAVFWSRNKGRQKFQLCGMEAAGIPLLTALLLCAPRDVGHINGFIIRKERKTTGLGNAIEGVVTEDPIIFVDDIINSASSVEKARVTLGSIGKNIDEVFAVIDYRSRKGMHWRNQCKISVDSLLLLDDFDLSLSKNVPPPPQKYKELWHTPVPGGYPFYVVPKSGPLLIDNRLYRGCDAGKMHAFDTETGAIVWEFQATGTATRKGIWSCPVVHDGRLYFGAYNGCIYCLDATTGKEIWTQSYGEWVGASPVIVPEHGLVYFGIEYERPWAQGSVGAFNLHNGQKVWEHRTKAFQHGSPVYWEGGDLIIWGTADHTMLGLDAKTGAVRWEFKTDRSVKYSPAVDEVRRLVAFASFDKSIYVLDVESGQLRGKWETGEICYTTPLFADGKLFCGSGDRNFYVIDVDAMQLVKKIDCHARIYSSPVRIDDRVIFGTSGGRVLEMDIKTLEVKGELQLPDAVTNAVAVAEDGSRIYVSSYMNHIFAFERIADTGA
jgi:outer membrane protein assembly factor BamB